MKLKKALSVLLTMCMLLSLIAAAMPTVGASGGTLSGAGTPSDPFLIEDASDWAAFAAAVASGENTDASWALDADISVTVNVTDENYASGATIGTEAHPFEGTFDGKGHTLTVDIRDTYWRILDFNLVAENQGAAPFRYIAGATIKNLKVEGSVFSSGEHPAGLVGFNQSGSSTIEDCVVLTDVTVDPAVSSHVGGVLAHNKTSTITMRNVVCRSALTTTTYNHNVAGGLVGWTDRSTVVLDNCVFDGNWSGNVDAFSPILIQNPDIDSLYHDAMNVTYTDVYYTVDPSVAFDEHTIGQFVINDTVSRKAFAGVPENTLYEYISEPFGYEYHIPCRITGVQPNYIVDDRFKFTVTTNEGVLLTTDSYDAAMTYNGDPYSSERILYEGTYFFTLSGKNGYTGTFTKTIHAYEEVPYIDVNGTEQTVFRFKVVDESTNGWEEGFLTDWYVVLGDVTIDGKVTVTGDINLLLCDGASLAVTEGIYVKEGNSITIWGQSGDNGKLCAGAGYGCAAIGMDNATIENSGDITIHGGDIEATGGEHAAGIGGGSGTRAGAITITGGKVKASGGFCGIGDGAAFQDSGCTINITYNSTSAENMSVYVSNYYGHVSLGKAFVDRDGLTLFEAESPTDGTRLNGKTLIPASNYYTINYYQGYESDESAVVYVLKDSEYTLPENTFTPPSALRPFVCWVVNINGYSTQLMQPGETITVIDNATIAARYRSEYGSLQTLIDNAASGDTITLDRDYVSDSGRDTVFTIPAGKTITIDLAGHTIDRHLTWTAPGEDCNVFTVEGTLTVRDTSANQDGAITGGNNTAAGGGVRVLPGGSFNLESGSVSGNRSPNGGGVYCNGTVTMTGGSVENNEATNSGGGIFVNDAGTLNLLGGTVTGNTVDADFHGGGIHTSGTLNVSGAPVVTGNTRNGAANNIGLYGGAVITVTGALTDGVSLGVNKSAANTTTLSTGVVTSGLDTNGDYTAFTSDNGSLVLGLTAGGEAILSAPLTVTFAAGYDNPNGSTDPITASPNIPFELPACGFSAPEHKFFAGWSFGGATKAPGDEIAVSAGTTVTAVWADTPYAVTIEQSVNGSILTDNAQATIGTTVTLTPDPDAGYALDTLTVTFGGESVATEAQANGTYTFEMPAGAVTVTSTFRTEIGTAAHPFEIHDDLDWDEFAARVAEYPYDYYKLADDFDDSTAISTPVGTQAAPFRGHFDGNSKTLPVAIVDTSASGTAPFRYIAGATIEDLTVTGTVTGGLHAAGLVGYNYGGASTISNVTVSVDVTNPGTSGNLHVGGVLGHNKNASVSMTNVVYDGEITNNGSFAGGLVGWSDSSTVVLTDCLFKGTYNGSGAFHPVAVKNGGDTVTATVTRVYYTTESVASLVANNVTNAGVHVYTAPAADTVNINVTAADGVTYYIPAEVRGLQSYYNNLSGAPFAPAFTLVGEDGTTLDEASDYTVAYSPANVAAPGEYTMTITGAGECSGSVTRTFTILGSIPYVDADGTAQTPVTEYTVIAPNTTALSGGWYVAAGEVTVSSRMTVSGNVNIILRDGATLTATKGICVNSGNTLTIWAQEQGTGELIATNEYEYAAIGGLSGSDAGTITINGGVIDARGGGSAAGIGGGDRGRGGNITINGGSVYAKGGADAAAIGGGSGGSGGNITINGGSVTAVGPYWGAGIGGGYLANGGTIEINGGDVTATSREAAAIGGGYKSYAGTIAINGGTVNASTTDCGAGIGMGQQPGYDDVASSVTISGGVVTAYSEAGYGIGRSQYSAGTSITVTLNHDGFVTPTSITANSVSGTVSLLAAFTDGTSVYNAGAVSDPSVFNEKTLTPYDPIVDGCAVFMGAAADSSKTRADLYFVIPDGANASDFTVTLNGVTTALDTVTPDANGYKFSITVPAKNMGDKIAYELIYKGTAIKSGEVSVADYAAHLAALYPQYADFTAAMLAYGAAAQTFFDYDADNLVSDADLTALAPVTADRFDAAAINAAMIADDAIPVKYSAMNVTFLADTTLSIAFRIKDGFTNDEALEWVNANITLDGAAVSGTLSTNGDYRFVVISKQNIAIDELDAAMVLAVGGQEYNVSVLNYFASVEAAGSDNLKLLTRALYAYSQAAKAIAG